jgi:hypothetical protein
MVVNPPQLKEWLAVPPPNQPFPRVWPQFEPFPDPQAFHPENFA